MSEYMDKHTISRLLGAPPGYVDYNKKDRVRQAMREKVSQLFSYS